ncbi:acyltransferase family protein [Tardiphaga sp.]|jgi:peptidoglycan/LPS O-acetylase OafA/YrhL|uniref:acyltransferase family protein n=1 Tax=Tardiphaga sp. TaxID=1926292 RepID=UPI0037DA550C
MQRIGFLESIRGLAAMQVVLLHVFSAFIPKLTEPAGPDLLGYLHHSPLFFLYDGYSAVYLFFILSGYVLDRAFGASEAGPIVTYVGRLVRLGLPALAVCVLATALFAIFKNAHIEAGKEAGSVWLSMLWTPELSLTFVLKDAIVNALLIGYTWNDGYQWLSPWQDFVGRSFASPMWSLSWEMFGSVIVYALVKIRRTSKPLYFFTVFTLCVFFIRSAYLCFILGSLAATFQLSERAPVLRARHAVPLIAVGIATCVVAEFWVPRWITVLCESKTLLLYPQQGAKFVMKIYGALMLFFGINQFGAARTALSVPRLVKFSELSFSIYLLHWPILFGPSAALYLVLSFNSTAIIAAFFASAATIIVTFLAAKIFVHVDRLAITLSKKVRRIGKLSPATSGSASK